MYTIKSLIFHSRLEVYFADLSTTNCIHLLCLASFHRPPNQVTHKTYRESQLQQDRSTIINKKQNKNKTKNVLILIRYMHDNFLKYVNNIVYK